MRECGKCVLLPLDGSQNSLTALGAAVRIAASVKGNLHIVHVSAEALTHDELIYRMGLPAAGVAGATVHSLVGETVDAIVERAAESDIGYVVLSTHGETGGYGRLTGSIAEGVMTRTDARVVMVSPRADMHVSDGSIAPIRNILVPLDGSPSSALAVPEALSIAKETGATIWMLHVPSATIDDQPAEPGSLFLESMIDRPEEMTRLGQEFMERFVHGCREYDESIQAHLEVSLGYPPQEIARMTARLGIDLVVTAWHGDLSAGRAQVLKSLLMRSTCPVLMVKGPAYVSRSHLRLAA